MPALSRARRDYSYAESWAEAPAAAGEEDAAEGGRCGGRGVTLTPTLVSVWLALTDCTLDNGCMVVLPKGEGRAFTWPMLCRMAFTLHHGMMLTGRATLARPSSAEHDPLFERPDHDDHLRVATEGARGVTECRFNLAAGRPLPAPAGSVLTWSGCAPVALSFPRFAHTHTAMFYRSPVGGGTACCGETKKRRSLGNRNTVHWGSACNAAGAGRPRRSMAVTFRRKDLSSGGCCPPSAAATPQKASAEDGGEAAAAAAAPAWLRGGLLSREQARALSLEDRLKLVAQGLLLYSRWYSMPSALPLPLVKLQ